MSAGLSLTISTPLDLVVDATGVTSVRAADASGSFGILPGHAAMVTVIPAAVIQWRVGGGLWAYCALRGGVLTMERGDTLRVACRQAIVGQNLHELETVVAERLRADIDQARRVKVQQARLHAQAIRQIMRHMRGATQAEEIALEGLFE